MRKTELAKLTVGGGIVFWAVTLAISLLPVAGNFRAAASYSFTDVFVGSLPSGLIIALCVTLCLPRFFNKIPTRNPILKSVILSFAGLLIIEVAVTLLHGSDELYYFVVGGALSLPRFLFLGITIGYLYERVSPSIKGFDDDRLRVKE